MEEKEKTKKTPVCWGNRPHDGGVIYSVIKAAKSSLTLEIHFSSFFLEIDPLFK